MEEMRLDNEPTEATLDQTIALNSVIQPRTHVHARTAQREDTPAASTPKTNLFLFNPDRPEGRLGENGDLALAFVGAWLPFGDHTPFPPLSSCSHAPRVSMDNTEFNQEVALRRNA